MEAISKLMKTYKPELKSVIDNFADIYPEPFVVYKRPKAGDLDVRPLTEAMKSQKPAPTIWAVHPKRAQGIAIYQAWTLSYASYAR